MARTFAATADQVTSGYTTENTQITLALWINRATSAVDRSLCAKTDTLGNYNLHLRYHAVVNVYYFVSWFSSNYGAWTAPAPAVDSWHHFAMTYDGGAPGNNPSIYYNGVSQTVTVDNVAVGVRNTNTNPWVLAATAITGNAFLGRLAEFGLWNRLLSANEINAVYQLGVGAIPDYQLWIPLWGADSPEPEFYAAGGGSATVGGSTRSLDGPPAAPFGRVFRVPLAHSVITFPLPRSIYLVGLPLGLAPAAAE